MLIDALIQAARQRRATDLHLEPGLPAAVRVDGELISIGEPLGQGLIQDAAQELLDGGDWAVFLERRSFDLSRVVGGVRCRLNILQSARGVGMVIRLFPAAIPRLAELNLHPDIARLAGAIQGLVIISGPTGSGKTTTLAALVQEINLSRGGHVLTVEQPIEYVIRPRRALVRQREVGRDAPSFEQALIDAMRQDPDVIVVGEMRTPEVMRLTLNASETGHLVFVTMHASTPGEALGRLIAAFPPETQRSVLHQLADVLVAVVCQQLVVRDPPGVRVPECEVLVATTPVRAIIRGGELYKLCSAMETGRDDGMWTRERYRAWLERRVEFASPAREEYQEEELPARGAPDLPSLRVAARRCAAAEGPADARAQPDEEADIEGLINQLSKPPRRSSQ